MSQISAKEGFGGAIVGFCQDGRYTEDVDLAAKVDTDDLKQAHELVERQKSATQGEIRRISKDVAPHVDSWIRHAGSLQKDIEQSKALGVTIRRHAEEGERLVEIVDDARAHTDFLRKEIEYNDLLVSSLETLKSIKDDIDIAEQNVVGNDSIAAAKAINGAIQTIQGIPNHNRLRAHLLLQTRAQNIKTLLHDKSERLWASLVQIDAQSFSIRLSKKADVEDITLDQCLELVGLLGQTEPKLEMLRHSLWNHILQPRIRSSQRGTVRRMESHQDRIGPSEVEVDDNISTLFDDMLAIVTFVSLRLPALAVPLSQGLLPEMFRELRETRLNSIIPIGIDDMTNYRTTVERVLLFEKELHQLGWTSNEGLSEWVSEGARLWFMKRKESDLVTIRDQLALGLVSQRTISRQEEQVVTVEDTIQKDEWDDGWGEEDDQDINHAADAQNPMQEKTTSAANDTSTPVDDDEEADAWGWNDDVPVPSDEPLQQTATKSSGSTELKEHTVTLRWQYLVSSMPDAVGTVIESALNDGLALTQERNADHPFASAAIALFSIPALALAMYKAVSPFYYQSSEGGNMFLYNDAFWLSETLESVSKQWNARADMTPKAKGRDKLGNEISSLQKFGKRAYAKEIALQKTIIKDLLRGDQCFLSDEGVDISDDEAAIDSVVGHVRAISSVWEPTLARTNWAQAVGSLLSTIAEKIITDVLDISGLQADASYNIATLIAKVVTLEALYLPKNDAEKDQLPLTAVEYAPYWLKLQYLSELLQSNLEAVRYLWFKGEASMFYTAEELIDLIELSFADSHRKTEIIRDIKHNRRPRQDLMQ